MQSRSGQPAARWTCCRTLWFLRRVEWLAERLPGPRSGGADPGWQHVPASHLISAELFLYCVPVGQPRCFSPKTRPTRKCIFSAHNRTPYVKDGIDNYIVHGRHEAVNPEQTRTKAIRPLSADGRRARKRRTIRARFSDAAVADSVRRFATPSSRLLSPERSG